MLLVFICVGAPLAFFVAPRAWRITKLLYAQRQAMHYSAAPDQIVYDDAPKDSFALLKASPEYFAFPRGEIGRFPGVWKAFYPDASPSAVLFLHERLSPKGERRLVVVSAFASRTVDRLDFGPEIYVESFGDVDASASYSVTLNQGIVLLPYDGKSRDLHILAGQVDQKDQSHFSIRFVANRTENFLDGTLKDGGGVHLELRK
jgi:hypothetical protein